MLTPEEMRRKADLLDAQAAVLGGVLGQEYCDMAMVWRVAAAHAVFIEAMGKAPDDEKED